MSVRLSVTARLSTWCRPSRTTIGAIIIKSLRGAGVERIERSGLCTACRPDLLYSYRKGNRGRLVTVAAIPR